MDGQWTFPRRSDCLGDRGLHRRRIPRCEGVDPPTGSEDHREAPMTASDVFWSLMGLYFILGTVFAYLIRRGDKLIDPDNSHPHHKKKAGEQKCTTPHSLVARSLQT